MRSRVRSFFALFGVLMLSATALVALAPAAGADTLGPVDASIPDGDPGSLRDVLENQANDGDVVQLQAGATYQLTDCEANEGGNLSTDAALTVEGNGATIEQTCDSYVWEIGENTTIDALTLTGGFDRAGRPAGAIHMDGDELVITNSSIVGNQTCGDGGGIYMHTGGGLVHVENSTIAGNTAGGAGGAIASNGGSDTDIEIVNSTITGNSAGWSGGIDLQQGEDLSLTYVTLAGNTTDAEGIPCDAESGSVSDVHGTVTPAVHAQANGSAANVQFDDTDSTLTTFGSVIALPVQGPNCDVQSNIIESQDALENTDSQGYNYSDDTSCDLTGTGDRQGAADPQLLPLGPNGGPTETRPPAETSPLIDGVALAECHPDGIAADQRGIVRPQRAACDVGAVELVALTPTPAPEPLPLVVTPRFTG
jgi:hypothetical protein